MNKFDRVFSILILLQTKKVLTAAMISDKFDISLRTVYRDINTLRNAGVPIIGDPGVGYSIMEGYRVPPMMFNESEASALLTAEKFIGKLTDKETQAHYQSAMLKIKSILRGSEKQSLSVLDDSIAISDNNNWSDQSFLQDMFRSVAARYVMEIEYRKVDGTVSKRKLEAIGCYHQFNTWYLIAYCQSRKDYRIFKADRIVNLKVLEEHFNTNHISLKDYIDQQDDSWKEKQKFYEIEVAFSKQYLEFAEKRKYYFGFVEQIIKEDWVHMKFFNDSIEYVARWIMQFGDQATAIAPIELVDRMKTLAADLNRHYN